MGPVDGHSQPVLAQGLHNVYTMFTYFSNRILFNATILPVSVLIALKTTPYVPEKKNTNTNFVIFQNEFIGKFISDHLPSPICAMRW